MASKRPADWDHDQDISHYPSASKRARVTSTSTPISSNSAVLNPTPGRPSFPRVIYRQHPESGIGKEFHSVPYPLTLLPKKSWEALNRGDQDGAVCTSCGKPKSSTPHQRKLFLVAERLSWELGTVSYAMRSQNEVSLWAVNAELAIYEPAVDDEEVILGGRRSRHEGQWFPYRSKAEAETAMRIVARAENLGESTWLLWKNMADLAVSLSTKSAHDDLVDLTGDEPVTKQNDPGRSALQDISPNSHLAQTVSTPGDKGKSAALPAPQPTTISQPEARCEYQQLSDFYSLLDKIERTSPMGARFLEAYAERLHTETCKDCWFAKTILQDQLHETADLEPAVEATSSSPAFAPAPAPAPHHRYPPPQPFQPAGYQPTHLGPQFPAAYGLPMPPIPSARQAAPPHFGTSVPPQQNGEYMPRSAGAPPRQAAAPPAQDPQGVVRMLGEWARSDPRLAALFDKVARRIATRPEVQEFNVYAARARALQPPSALPQPPVGVPYRRVGSVPSRNRPRPR